MGLVLKLPKLEKPLDFIQKKRRINAFIRKDDLKLVALSPKPSGEGVTNEPIDQWEQKLVKAKSNIVFA